jgi:hypothetical protein
MARLTKAIEAGRADARVLVFERTPEEVERALVGPASDGLVNALTTSQLYHLLGCTERTRMAALAAYDSAFAEELRATVARVRRAGLTP